MANHDDVDLLRRTSSGIKLVGVQLNPQTLAAAFCGGKRVVSSCALDNVDVRFNLGELYSRPVEITIRSISILERSHPPHLSDYELADLRDQLRGSTAGNSVSKQSSGNPNPTASTSTSAAAASPSPAASQRYSKKQRVKDAFTIDVNSLRFVQVTISFSGCAVNFVTAPRLHLPRSCQGTRGDRDRTRSNQLPWKRSVSILTSGRLLQEACSSFGEARSAPPASPRSGVSLLLLRLWRA